MKNKGTLNNVILLPERSEGWRWRQTPKEANFID